MNKETSSRLSSALNPVTPGKRRTIFIAPGTLLLLLAGWLVFSPNGNNGALYLTEKIRTGDLAVTVSATGKLYPTNQVDVGSELSGIVEKVFVEENDRVSRGQELARLDLSRLNDQVVKSQAAVLAAEAQVAQMQATVKETRASLSRQRRLSELSGGTLPSPSDLDAVVATVARAEANEANARAAAAQAVATLRSDRTNLSKASIRSPIDGIVLMRKIEPGQTVAASLQAPVLFTLAEDLARMQLQVDVDEADVSQVKPGQAAYFTVDAWPGRRYPAQIRRVGFGAQTTEGVVTYKTLLDVANDDLSLRPGMTATAEIATASLSGVLQVPNAALRFTPAAAKSAPSGSFVSSLLPRRPMAPKAVKENTAVHSSTRTIWLLRDRQPTPVEITVGLSDGRTTQVVSGALQAGDVVITGTRKSAQ